MQRGELCGEEHSVLFLACMLVFSLSRFSVRFSRRVAEDGPHPKLSGASERFASGFRGRSIMPYSLLTICNDRVVGVN